MFEGPFLHPALAPDQSEPLGGADSLRMLGWAELSARLGAARDYRRLMVVELRSGGGSFDGGSARRLASFAQGKRDINPIALTNGKMPGCISAAVVSDQSPGDRGSQ
jgi:hypothetical protein